jgi:hypothetical protein
MAPLRFVTGLMAAPPGKPTLVLVRGEYCLNEAYPIQTAVG